MVRVYDVADYVLHKVGFVSTMKLQKLVYYSQALSLSREGEPLFDEDFQAWANGPVCPELFHFHRGMFVIGPGELGVGQSGALDGGHKAIVDKVIDSLGMLNGGQLSELTHSEEPWLSARGTYKRGERCNTVITKGEIARYYSQDGLSNPLFNGN